MLSPKNVWPSGDKDLKDFFPTAKIQQENLGSQAIDIAQNCRYSDKGLKNKPPSSSGLGHLPFTEATGIRIPLGVYRYAKGESQKAKGKSWLQQGLLLVPMSNTLMRSRRCIIARWSTIFS